MVSAQALDTRLGGLQTLWVKQNAFCSGSTGKCLAPILLPQDAPYFPPHGALAVAALRASCSPLRLPAVAFVLVRASRWFGPHHQGGWPCAGMVCVAEVAESGAGC